MASIWILVVIVISFISTWLLGKKVIPYLHKLKYGQTILEIGPSWHKNKQGTPTMGGIMFIFGIYLSLIICMPLYLMFSSNNIRFKEPPFMTLKIIAGLFMALAYGVVGFLDDYIKIVKKRNLGLTALQKLILQFLIVGSYWISLYFAESSYGGTNVTSTFIPFIGRLDLGIFYWPIAAVVIVGMVNAVNLTDGIDGLSTSVTFFVAIFLMLISGFLGMISLSLVCGALIGGCFAFLTYNIHPAKVFMGDTGSLFLGGLVCAIAFSMNMPIILPVVGIIYVVEMLSVMIQVTYFKITKGKRLFKMAPLHHHFEMCGWNEMKICTVFDIVTMIFGILTVVCVIYGY